MLPHHRAASGELEAQGGTFENGHLPETRPFGNGLNVQIRADTISVMVEALRQHDFKLYLEPEDKWYRVDEVKSGNRQLLWPTSMVTYGASIKNWGRGAMVG